MIEVGKTYRFAHRPFMFEFGGGSASEWYDGYRKHIGQSVCVLNSQPCMNGRLYGIQAADGWRGCAFEDELKPLLESVDT